MKMLACMRILSLAVLLTAMLAHELDYQGPLADPYTAVDFIQIYFRAWIVLEAIYWHARYRELLKAKGPISNS